MLGSVRLVKQIFQGIIPSHLRTPLNLDTFSLFVLVQWKPLNVIALGQTITDNINKMITIKQNFALK
jgi:hypothetical protein